MLVFSTATFAQFKIPKNPMGSMMGAEEEEQEPAGDITQIQARLVNDVADAYPRSLKHKHLLLRHKGMLKKPPHSELLPIL